MRTYDLTDLLNRLMRDRGMGGCQVAGIDAQGVTYQIVGADVEYHEDADEAATFWIRLEEN